MSLETEAQAILETLSSMSFETCYPLSRKFANLPITPSLYAVRHRRVGILYIGLAVNLRRRFKDTGHKALVWAFLDYFSPDDVRMAVEPLTSQSFREADQLDTLLIQMAQPRYNVRKKRED